MKCLHYMYCWVMLPVLHISFEWECKYTFTLVYCIVLVFVFLIRPHFISPQGRVICIYCGTCCRPLGVGWSDILLDFSISCVLCIKTKLPCQVAHFFLLYCSRNAIFLDELLSIVLNQQTHDTISMQVKWFHRPIK